MLVCAACQWCYSFRYARLWVVVLAEHLLFLIKYEIPLNPQAAAAILNPTEPEALSLYSTLSTAGPLIHHRRRANAASTFASCGSKPTVGGGDAIVRKQCDPRVESGAIGTTVTPGGRCCGARLLRTTAVCPTVRWIALGFVTVQGDPWQAHRRHSRKRRAHCRRFGQAA